MRGKYASEILTMEILYLDSFHQKILEKQKFSY